MCTHASKLSVKPAISLLQQFMDIKYANKKLLRNLSLMQPIMIISASLKVI